MAIEVEGGNKPSVVDLPNNAVDMAVKLPELVAKLPAAALKAGAGALARVELPEVAAKALDQVADGLSAPNSEGGASGTLTLRRNLFLDYRDFVANHSLSSFSIETICREEVLLGEHCEVNNVLAALKELNRHLSVNAQLKLSEDLSKVFNKHLSGYLEARLQK